MLRRPLGAMACCFLLGILAAANTKIPVVGYVFAAVVLSAASLVCRRAWQRRGGQNHVYKSGGEQTLIILLCVVMFIGGYHRYECEQQLRAVYLPELTEGMQLSVQGKLAGKQIKNDQYIYELESCAIGPNQIKRSNQEPVPCNRIYVYSDSDEVSIGEILVLDGTVELWNSAVNEGNFNANSYYLTHKVDFKLKNVTICGRYGSPCVWKEKLWQLKLSLKEVFREKLGEKECGVMTTMVLGDKELLTSETKRLYQIAGLLHITAISGLHISVIGMTLYRILRRFGMGFGVSAICAGTLMYGYGVMVGMGTSVQRAILMFLLLLVAAVVGRSYDTLNALGAAAIFLLWGNPFLLWDAGFQLSFAAILGVAWVGKSMSFGRSCLEKFCEKIYISMAIQLTTLPLVAWYYYEIPIYALLINLLILPMVGILLGLGILGGVIGLAFSQVASFLLFPCQKILEFSSWLCTVCGKLPGAMWITGKPKVGQIVGYYVLLVLVTMWAYRRKRGIQKEAVDVAGTRKIGSLPEYRKVAKRLLGLQVSDGEMDLLQLSKLLVEKTARWLSGVCIFVAILCVPIGRGFELDILDVGQGDAGFLRTKQGYTIFVDGGSTDVKKVGEYRILPFLKYKGADRIDCWIVSHADEDHISGLRELFELGYDIRCLVFSEAIVQDEAFFELSDLAEQAGTEVVYMKVGDSMHLGDAVIRAVYPFEDVVDTLDKNASSLVVWYEEGDFSAIFTGDIGTAEEQKLVSALGKVDFYKAAHHGSKYSNSEELLKVLRPEIATVSCSATNRYGHPGKEAIEHMEDVGCEIYYTMESGQITIKREEGIEVYEFTRQ